MSKMKLGAKITFGFVLLLALAMALGGMAIFNMGRVETNATRLAREHVPETAVASQIERSVLQAMLATRSYGHTGAEEFLKQGKERLAEAGRQIKTALDHAGQYPALVGLRNNATQAQGKIKEYEQLLDRTAVAQARAKVRQETPPAREAEA